MTLQIVSTQGAAFIPPQGSSGQTANSGMPSLSRDPLLERLVQSLLPPEQASEVLRGYYTDALHTTLLKRLASIRDEPEGALSRPKTMKLPYWRLRRVTEYVDRSLDERISLATLAQAAGLSRMHFAALFRAATGMRPHDYVMQRRIQRAKELLAGTQTPIVDVALSVGFQTQAHFTTVFKRVVGFTPYRWRVLRSAEAIGA